jgi:L-ascorbate metabolism protein UlaG (beta-lactamase superfamily)
MIKIHQTKCDTAGCLLSYEKSTVLSFWWLGQAGFAFQFMDTLNLIDPYLSDCLAEKYREGISAHSHGTAACPA